MVAQFKSVRAKIYVTVTIIFFTVIGLVTAYTMQEEQERVLAMTKQQVQNAINFYFEGLNTMMMTRSMKERGILRQKILKQPGII